MNRAEQLSATLLQVAGITELCVDRGAHITALILLYSGIDAMGWLTAENPSDSARQRFTAWVDRFMLPERPLPCTSTDLYAARCGLLHTFTADSRLAAHGEAKRLYYFAGPEDEADSRRLEMRAPPGALFIKLEDLSEAFRLGLAKMIEASQTDAGLAATIIARSSEYFTLIPSCEFDAGIEDDVSAT